MAATIIEPGYVEASAGNAPFWRRPDRANLFSERAQRFKHLATDHRLADFLLFMAAVAEAQHQVLSDQGPAILPGTEQLDLCKTHGMPPLNHQSHQRSPEWRAGLHLLMTHIAEHANPATRSSIAQIQALPDHELEKLADRILAGEYANRDLAVAPLVGAALQVYWARMSAALDTSAVHRSEMQNSCPACGAAPSVSVVRIGGA
ncbi:MAG TPA: formate dehydrogenase accessory protein FdhE, partial [Burkholderiales bacterium]|nr:formate dehydrogenase accessory protein FdhE [Burkholderiales bacterium]